MKKYKYIAMALAFGMFATACGNKAESPANTLEAEAAEADSVSQLFSNRDLSGAYDEEQCERITLSDGNSASEAEGVTVDGNTITITKEGDYLINGSLSNGMVIVDADKTEKVQLILNGVNINSETSAAIYVKQADKVFVTLADGTTNVLTNGGSFLAIDDNNIDAVIFSKDDLTLNGTGSLVISSPAGHGVVSKNDLVITNGSYEITAASHGLSGKDSVAAADGSFDIEAGKDAVHSENDEDDTAGNVYIADGNFSLCAESDGISAMNEIYIAGGSIVVEQSYEGIEGRVINIYGGEIDITSSDDGLNATDKRTKAASETEADKTKERKDFAKKFQGGGMDDTQSDASIHIAGGIITIDAEGDGIDSNGYLTVSGGEVYIAGPSNGGNGALDYGIDASISGGIVVAAGQSGMAQNFGSESTQGAILISTQQQNEAGSDIVLLDSDGRELAAWNMKKNYNSVVISCPEIEDGGSYTVKTGETTTEVTMDGLIYGETSAFGGGMRRKN